MLEKRLQTFTCLKHPYIVMVPRVVAEVPSGTRISNHGNTVRTVGLVCF